MTNDKVLATVTSGDIEIVISPSNVGISGPGIDLLNQPEGLSIQMSDPVRDLAYARNAVTLTFDLYGYANVRLLFDAMEYGDEPHALYGLTPDEIKLVEGAAK
jgi:hypothetical protein